MTAGERFKNWIDGLAEDWKDRLRGWMASWLEGGVIRLFDFLEPDLRSEIKPSLLRIKEIPGLPEDFKVLIDKTLEEPKAIHLAAILPYLIGIMIGLGMGAAAPLARMGAYQIDKLVKSARLDPMSVIIAWRRDPAKYEKLFDDLKDQGWNPDRIEAYKFLTQQRLDPMSWVTASRRKYEDFSKIEDDLRHQGWDTDRIEALKFTTKFYPTPQDLVLWLAREVFEDEMIERYGLRDEAPLEKVELFEKAGVDKDQMLNFWMAHWQHASYMQVVEMLHRGLLTLSKETPAPPTSLEGWEGRDAEGTEAMFEWYRLVEIPPFWRDKLTAMSWNVPTRVDVRRFWDMRTISEERLRSIYHAQGYHGEDLEDYIRWTKVYTDFPMMMTRFRNGWITEEDIRSWLKGLEIPEDRIDQFIEEKTKPEKPAQVEQERQATATEIMKAVKMELRTEAEGIEMLGDLGYSEEVATFKLEVYGAIESGSPETYEEFKQLTQSWRKAVGMEAKPLSKELIAAAAAVVKFTKDVESLKRAIEEEERKLIDVEILPAEATERRDELRLTLHRAEAELHRVKTDYNSLVAEWRHKEAQT